MADDANQNDSGGKGFLTRQYFHLPMWAWIAIGIAATMMIRSYMTTKSGTQSTTSTTDTGNGTNGNGTPPNIFFLPQGAGGTVAPPQVSVTINRQPGNGGTSGTPGTPVSNHPPIGGSGGPAITPVPGNVPPVGPATPAQKYQTVTVERWPGNSSGGLAGWDTTLWGIANHFGTTVDQLAQLNNISNPNLIYPGEQIRVPTGG